MSYLRGGPREEKFIDLGNTDSVGNVPGNCQQVRLYLLSVEREVCGVQYVRFGTVFPENPPFRKCMAQANK